MRKQRKPSWARSHSAKPKRVSGRRERARLRQAKRERYA
jgi:hypothetical protein